MPNKYYWDSDVFLSAIDGVEDRVPIISQQLDAAEKKQIDIITSHLSIAEVCFAKAEKQGGNLDDSIEEKIDKLWDAESPVKVVELHELISRNAKRLIRASLKKRLALRPADAIHFATAMVNEVNEFNTYDLRLFKFSSMMGFKICNPRVDQMEMFPSHNSPLRWIRDQQEHWQIRRRPRLGPNRYGRYLSILQRRNILNRQ
jgi:predicted nucleic acid-binding protein